MSFRPQFSHEWDVRVLAGEGVVLDSAADTVVLEGHLVERLAPLLDGSRTAEEVAAAIADEVDPTEAHFALLLLQRDGYVVDAGALPEEAGAWRAAGFAPDRRLDDSSRMRTALDVVGPAQAEPLTATLEDMRITVDPEADRRVVVAGDYLDPAVEALAHRHAAGGQATFFIRASGPSLWVGPVIVPGETVCWSCVAYRLRTNRSGADSDASILSAVDKHQLHAAAIAHAGLASLQIARWLVDEEPDGLRDRILTLALNGLRCDTHHVVGRPGCPVCGIRRPASHEGIPPEVLGIVGLRGYGTGTRSQSPETTLDRYEGLVSPLTGIVRSLEHVPVEPPDLAHVYVARYGGRSFETLQDVHRGLKARSGGKGTTPVEAQASALCEALERHSGTFRGDEHRVRARLGDLDGAIHPNDCMLFSERQYEHRTAWNRSCGRTFHRVPEPFEEMAVMDWSPVWSLTEERWRHLPSAYLYYEHPETDVCRADSNGCAAGNTCSEAFVAGFLELVERDSVALWWYNRVVRPGVALHSFEDAYVDALVDAYHRMGRNIWVLDVTSDVGIPAFAAVSRAVDAPHEALIMGFGAHFDARTGIRRALTEVNQLLPFVTTSNGRKAPLPDDPFAASWFDQATVDAHPYLRPRDGALRSAADYPAAEPGDPNRCIDIADRLGVDVLVLDQTRADIQLPVVKVIVPGLRHFWRRLARGRLYEAPVAAGWMGTAQAEADLNPVPLFL